MNGFSHRSLLVSVAVVATLAATPAQAQERSFDIPAQPAASAIATLGRQADIQIVAARRFTRGKRTNAVRGAMTTEQALTQMFSGTGLQAKRSGPRTFTIVAQAELGLLTEQAPPAPGRMEGEDQPSPEIVVTGSLLGGVRQASPIATYSQEEIIRSGNATIERFMETLPQNFGGGASQDTANSSTDFRSRSNRNFGSTVTLRGLGAGSTLVLLNGRRLAPGGNKGAFVDISMIPVSAIQRVDVLTDGASALYGSDAVGGVVNFQLKERFDGAELRLRSGMADGGKAVELLAAPSAGINWNGGGLILAYEYYQQAALRAADRAFTLVPATSDASLLPEQRRHSLFASGHHYVTPELKLYGTALVSKRESFARVFSRTVAATGTYDGESRQRNYQLGATYTLGDGMDLDIAYVASRQAEDSLATPVPGAPIQGATTPTTGRTRTTARAINALFRTELIDMPGGPAKLALGGDMRWERYAYEVQAAATTTSDTHRRRVSSAYGELYLPLTDRPFGSAFLSNVSVSLAGRYDSYSDFGSSFVPKVGVRTNLTPGIAVRATYSKSFRAPLLSDMRKEYYAYAFMVPDPTNLSGRGTGQALLFLQDGGIDLHEERATSWTSGFDVKLGDAVTLSLTGYRITYDGKITVATQNAYDYLNFPNVYAPLITLNPSASTISQIIAGATGFYDATPGAIFVPGVPTVLVREGQQNIGRERQTGIDAMLHARLPLGSGTLNASLNATYILDFKREIVAGGPPRSLVDTVYNPIDLRVRSQIGWSSKASGASLSYNYSDSYRNDTILPASKIEALHTVDLLLWTMISGAETSRRSIQFNLSVNNLFDAQPPKVGALPSIVTNMGYDTSNADPIGRFIALEVRARW
jgi:iron complex outermembrane receptor protein